jgi:uroporphyrin-III C-methyltransferase
VSSGKVWLVGAGPGDPELLTVRAVNTLKKADVILCDDLVGEDVLAYAPPSARIVRVGKRGGAPSTPQDFIERLMIAEAREGHRVVRLKGGDPLIFGRAGEEREALEAAGIECEVVNGVSAALAAAAALRIPLTHRALCHGAIFVTGHGEGPDWNALAATGLPLVIYMGVARCAQIRERLLAAGMAAQTPAAAVAHASLPQERSVATTLARMPEDLAAAGIDSPAVIVIGEVARNAAGNRAAPAAQAPRPAPRRSRSDGG